MKRVIFIFVSLLLVLPTFAGRRHTGNLDIVEGIVVEKWELGKWQVDDDWTVLEGYSRFKVLVESPLNLRGRTFTLFYRKWNVPKNFIPKRKGVRCGFAVPTGSLGRDAILWSQLRFFWLIQGKPSLLPVGTPRDSD